VAEESKQPDIRHLLEEVKRLTLSLTKLKKEVKAQIAAALRQQQQHPRRQRGQSNYTRPAKVIQGNICHTIGGNNTGKPNKEEVCYSCFSRDKDNCLTPNSEHTL
jgi:regulator of replication initiation timing